MDKKPKFRDVQKLVTGAVIGGTEIQTLAGVQARVPALPCAACTVGVRLALAKGSWRAKPAGMGN